VDYAEIKKAPLDLTGRVSGRIGDPGFPLRQLPGLASRHFGGVAAAGLTVLRFGPPLPAPTNGATPPNEIVDNSVAGLRRTCVIFGPDPEICDEPTLELSETPGRATKGRAMSYCITLRSRTDETITGWYAGRNTRWSTDHKRQKRFDDPGDAGA
jgi:hypothetical protein